MDTESNTKGRERTELLGWMVRLGAVTAEALAGRDGCSAASARGRLQGVVRAGLASRFRRLHGAPALFTATPAGMALTGLQGEQPSRVSAAGARHQVACASAAVGLERRFPEHLVCGERELQREERILGERLASARMSWRSRWGDSHRPDLVMWPLAAGADPVAVEVELTAKAPARLAEICRAWARCPHVAGVLYLAAVPAFAPVARAIRAVGAEERITLLGLEAVAGSTPEAGLPPKSPVTGAP
jgi:hypothetical protein